MLLALLAIIITLILVVGIHEAGHAVAARLAHVTISKVSIGFGKPLLHWRSKFGCEWVWSMWPLGGYVSLLNSRIAPVSPEELPFCFDKKPIGVRIGILIAGCAANLLMAWIGFTFVFLIGLKYQLPVIASVQPHSVAALSGIQSGDQILAIGSSPTPTFYDVGMRLIEFWGKKNIKIKVLQKNGELKTTQFDLSQVIFNAKNKNLLASFGLNPQLDSSYQIMRSHSFLTAMLQAFLVIVKLIYFFLVILKQLITGIIPFSVLLGPLGLFVISVNSFLQGLSIYIYFLASFSLTLALVNLFPIPSLDGGSIMYALIEKIRGEPISVAVEVLIHRLILIVFCVILVQLLINDLGRYFF